MTNLSEDLARILRANGVGPWIVDDFGRNQLVDEWAASFVTEALNVCADNDHEHAEQLERLLADLAEKPRKSITIAALRKILEG